MTDRPCPVCAAGGIAPPGLLWIKGGYRVVRCPGCGLAFVGNPPLPAELASLYHEDYFESGDTAGYSGYAQAEGRKRRHFSTLLDRLATLVGDPASGALLEVGSAYGFFLAEAEARGWRVTGVEPSLHAAEQARRRFGVRVLGTLDDLGGEADGAYRVVAAWDVIEHLPEPSLMLDHAYRLLAPGGVLAVSTGDFSSSAARLHGVEWSLMTPPWHLWFFTRRSLARLVGKAGLQVIAVDGDGTVLVDPHSPRPLLPGPIRTLLGASWLTTAFRRLGRGQIMTLYARKPLRP